MYKLKDISETNLINIGFRQGYGGSYTLRFPIYWWKKTPVVFCVASINPKESKRITLEIFREDGSIHKQWLEKNYTQAGSLLKKFEHEINKRMMRIGAKKYGEIND